jgi:hypothetical protein
MLFLSFSKSTILKDKLNLPPTCNMPSILKAGICATMKPTGHLLEKYSIQPEPFFTKLKSDEYKERLTMSLPFANNYRLQATPQC